MREVFRASGWKKLIVAVAVLLSLQVITAKGSGRIFSHILGVATTPMLKLTANAADKVNEYLDLDAMTKEELKEQNAALSKENIELRKQVIDYYNMVEENKQLKQQLKIQEQNPEVVHVAATVIARNPNDVFYGFSIDKGSLAGIREGDPVISEEGLVGVIAEVYSTTSKVKSLFSEDVKVASISKYYKESGVIGSNTMLAANGLLRMDYLLNDTKIQPGALITASGVGGVYPADLVIGYVTEVSQSEYNVSKYAIVQPYADIKKVKDVFVVTDFPGKDENKEQEQTEVPQDTPEAGE